MKNSRPKSAQSSYSSSSRSKPKMQTKFRQRTGSGVIQDLSESVYIAPRETPKSKDNSHRRSKSVIMQPSIDGQDFMKTSRILQQCNFKHHDPNICVCDQCTCGRHLCKLHTVKPDLPKASIYQKDFKPKSSVPNVVNIAKQYDKLKGPYLSLDSSYAKGFSPRKGDDLERPKPEDLLKTGGPSPQLSSYKADYPGHKGKNQYVPPTDKHRREDFPLKGNSTYGSSFPYKKPKEDDWEGIPNNLKTGGKWLGGSTYKDIFKSPNPEHYPQHVKVKQKLELNPNYCRQYETTYRNNFLNKGRGVCPAKITLQSKKKGFFKDSKINFEEKADYKALSPDFQAISTSKFSYVN